MYSVTHIIATKNDNAQNDLAHKFQFEGLISKCANENNKNIMLQINIDIIIVLVRFFITQLFLRLNTCWL